MQYNMVQSKTKAQYYILIILFGIIGTVGLWQIVQHKNCSETATADFQEFCFSFPDSNSVYLHRGTIDGITQSCELAMLLPPPAKRVFFFSSIPINQADALLLRSVRGVGKVTADRILNWRGKYGDIRNTADLQRIPGIGRKKALYLASQFNFDSQQ